MTPSARKAINESKTMLILVRAMQEGAEITHRSHAKKEALNLIDAQVRTYDMQFDWIVTPRGRIVHEDYSVIPEHMRDELAT